MLLATAGSGGIPLITVGDARMATSHRRPSLLTRIRCRCRMTPAMSSHRQHTIDLVDARTHVQHRVTPEAMNAGRQSGLYRALCGIYIIVGSMTDQGLRQCAQCSR
jgi:hypothetical protein